MTTPEQVFAKDLSNLAGIVSWATEQQSHGSFSARRPDLGRMFRCPHCHQRRRANGPRCCNPAFAMTQRAWSVDHNVPGTKPERTEKGFGPTTRHEKGFYQTGCDERANESPFSRSFMKKIHHKRHGQSREFKIRHLTGLFNQNWGGNDALKNACKEMHVKVPDLIGIPPLAEKFFAWREERKDRAARRRARDSRRINRGLSV